MFEDEIAALQGLFQPVIDLPTTILNIVGACLLALVYPLVKGVFLLESLLNLGYSAVVDLINAIMGFPNLFIDIINVLFVGVFPSDWTTVMIIGLIVAFGFRAYSFLKDVEILGNKI